MKINVKYILAAAVSAALIVLFVILGNKGLSKTVQNEVADGKIPEKPIVLLSDEELAIREAEKKKAEEDAIMAEILERYRDELPPEDTSRMAEYNPEYAAPESELIMYDYEIYDNDDGDYLHFMREQIRRPGVRSMVDKQYQYTFFYDTLGRLIQNPGIEITYKYRKNILTVTYRESKNGKIYKRSTTVYKGNYPVERTYWYSSGMEKWEGYKEYWAYDSLDRMISYRQHDFVDTTIGREAWIRYSSDGRHRGIMTVLLPHNPEHNNLEYMEETVFDSHDRPVLTFAYNSFDYRTEIITEYSYADSVSSSPFDKTVTWYIDGRPHHRICSFYDEYRTYTGDVKYKFVDKQWVRTGGSRYTVEYDDRGNTLMRQIHSATRIDSVIYEYTYY